MATFTNPVLRGGYPDPSICSVDGVFYLTNSTFEHFPGLPIHRSTDLVNWELIGNALDRAEQVSGPVNLVDVQTDGGIHAPTIRHYEGTFYIITTNVYVPVGLADPAEQTVNFILTASDPAGPWSQPHVIEGAPGIDPDLFFDVDGSAWYVGTHTPPDPSYDGEGEIWLQRLDLETFSLVGERHYLWRGACGGTWVEGPHLYRERGRYYLLVAEGGTGFTHAVMVASSEQITGPYRSNPRNPVLTSRHLSYDHWIHSTGHADLVQVPDGRWFAVCLGKRGEVQRQSNMGRETHLVPVIWQDEPLDEDRLPLTWPVLAPEAGRVEREQSMPLPGEQRRSSSYLSEAFEAELGPQWLWRRLPREGSYRVDDGLHLQLLPQTLAERERCGLLGVRQPETGFQLTAVLADLEVRPGAEAGIAVVQTDQNHLTCTVRADGEGRHAVAALDGALIGDVEIGQQGPVELSIVGDADGYTLSVDAGAGATEIARADPEVLLSRGYSGALLGLYATGNGVDGGTARFTRCSITVP